MKNESNTKRPIGGVKSIAIENTTLCGADCIMCPRHNFKHKKENMDFDLFKKIVDEVAANGIEFINMCGFGDPAIDVNFTKELSYIKTNYPHINVGTTNTCHLISGKILEAVIEFVDEIQISMYGMTKETYEAVHRGALKFEEVKHNIDVLLSQEKRPFVVMEFLVMEENKKDMKAWIDYYKDKADRLDVWRLQNWAGYLPNEDEHKPFVKCFRIDTLNGLYVRTDGSISMCCVDYNRDVTIGNIKNQSFSDIINGDTVKQLQQMNDEGNIKNHPICKHCDQIRDRSDALIFSTDKKMSVGKHSLFTNEEIYL